MSVTNSFTFGQQKQLQSLLKAFNSQPPLPKKIKQRKQFILLKLPLFMTIFQKKGDQNFQLIVNSIKLTKFQFGDVILSSDCLNDDNDIDQQSPSFQRTFNYILKGHAILFTTKQKERSKIPQFYKKLGPNQYFGQKISFRQDRLHQVKALTTCYTLQLDINTFYNTFQGHFQYAELKDKIMFMQKIWIFSELRRSSIQKVLFMSQTQRYKRNTVLFNKGLNPQFFYVIVVGQLALYEKQKNQKVKYTPFCLLGRSQVCGLQEMALQKAYQHSGVVTSQFLEVLIINRQIYEKYLTGYIASKLNVIRRIHEQRDKLKGMSIKYDKQYKQVAQSSKKRQSQLLTLFVQGFTQAPQNPGIQIQKVELNHAQQLKNPNVREYRLRQIKQRQSRQFNSSSLSSLTNNNYTKDKELLINYLMKKQRVQRRANLVQFRYQQRILSQSGVVKQIHVQQSSAVKQHKRRLIKSRYWSLSPLKK